MTVEGIIEAPRARQGMAKCPANENQGPSLSVRELGGRLLVHCSSGGDQLTVVEALRPLSLWPEVGELWVYYTLPAARVVNSTALSITDLNLSSPRAIKPDRAGKPAIDLREFARLAGLCSAPGEYPKS